MKKLLAYKTKEGLLGIDIEEWSIKDLDGKKPFLYVKNDDEIPFGYQDISSIVNWVKFGGNTKLDYLAIQREIKEIINNSVWDSLTIEERDLAIDWYAIVDYEEVVIYLMVEKEMPEAEARMFVLKKWHNHHNRMVESCKERWNAVKYNVGAFLRTIDAEHLFNIVSPLIYSFTETVIFGKNYGDHTDGLMDFIESTNFYENSGLKEQNYQLNFGTYEIFISELKKVLVDGIY